MIPPAQPALPPPNAEALGAVELGRLRDTPDFAVGRAATQVAGLSEEEEAGRKRSIRDRRRRVWLQVEGWAIRAVGAIGILLALTFATLVCFVVARWLGFVMKDPKKLDDLVTGAVWTLLVGGASSWATMLLKRDD